MSQFSSQPAKKEIQALRKWIDAQMQELKRQIESDDQATTPTVTAIRCGYLLAYREIRQFLEDGGAE